MQLELSLADRVSIMRKAFIPSYPITVMVVNIENQLHGYIRRYCFLRGRKKRDEGNTLDGVGGGMVCASLSTTPVRQLGSQLDFSPTGERLVCYSSVAITQISCANESRQSGSVPLSIKWT